MTHKILYSIISTIFLLLMITSCKEENERILYEYHLYKALADFYKQESVPFKRPPVDNVVLIRDLKYKKYTLEDNYNYKGFKRKVQWDKIAEYLKLIDSIQIDPAEWAYLDNYRNRNESAPIVANATPNSYGDVSDVFGIDRYQSIPLYATGSLDSITKNIKKVKPLRYGLDGSIIKINFSTDIISHIEIFDYPGNWLVPTKYVRSIESFKGFGKAIIIDRANQNIVTTEKSGNKWLIRSINPATTGMKSPPYSYVTPKGIFTIIEKKPKMYYLHNGTKDSIAGFAPYASRFSNGAYIHGVPVALPDTEIVEYSNTLGTSPRSHRCVRNATSHAEYIYKWAPIKGTAVIVID